MAIKRHLSGVKLVHSDEALQTIIERVESKLGPAVIDSRRIIHPTDCRCHACWIAFQRLWVSETMRKEDE